MVKGVGPGLQILTGNRIYKVNVDARKTGLAGDLDAAGDVGGVVVAFEELELGGIETLRAEAQAIDAGFAQHLAVVERDGRWVGFDGPLVKVVKVEAIAEVRE